jgi:hypothetical protein
VKSDSIIFRCLQAGREPGIYSISHGDLFEFGNIGEGGRLERPFMTLRFIKRKIGWRVWNQYRWEVEATLIPNAGGPPDWISALFSTIEGKKDK